MKRHRAVVVAAMCAVVFATTYALILPAVTLNQETADLQPGIELDAPSEDAGEGMDAGQRDDAGGDSQTAETTAADSDERPASAADAAKPEEAPNLIAEPTTITYAGDGYDVSAEVDEAAKLPTGVKLKSKEITAESDAESYQNYSRRALSALKAEDESVTALSNLRLFDITFVNEAGEKVEPESDVQVKLKYDEAADVENSERVKVVHFEDSGAVSVVGEEKTNVSTAKGKIRSVGFEAASFSVYAIAETTDENHTQKTYRRTYTFQNDDGSPYEFTLGSNSKSISVQILKKGEAFQDVGVPIPKKQENKNREFLGWGVVTDANGDVTIGEPQSYTGVVMPDLTKDETITLRAVFSTKVNIIFHNYDGAVLTVAQAEPESKLSFSTYQPDSQISVEDEVTKSFIGWNTDQKADSVLASPWTVPNEDTHMYPVYSAGHWIDFDGNAGTIDSTTLASYTDSILIKNSVASASDKPADPTRPGYDFGGWYTDSACSEGNALNFDGTVTLTQNITAYAKWIPKSDVQYTVAFWLQDADDDNYSYAGNVKETGTAGNETSYSATDAANDISDESKLPAFKDKQEYIKIKDNTIKQETIRGDTSTIVNVYFDRKNYTLRFYYAYNTTKDNVTSFHVHTETTPFSNNTGNTLQALTAQADTSEETVPTLPNPSGYSNTGTVSVEKTVNGTTTTYTYYYFDIVSRIGAKLDLLWPSQPFGTYTTDNGILCFVSWATRVDSGYYKKHSNKNIKGPYSKFDASLVADTDDSKGHVAESFLAYWHYPSNYKYEIYYSLLNGETSNYTYDGTGYKRQGEYSIGSTAIWSAQNALTFEGVKAVSDTPVSHSGQDSSDKGGSVVFLYQRISRTISFVNKSNHTIATDTVPFGENMSNENAVNRHLSEAEKAAEDGYEFVGWYDNPEREGEAFKFTGTMPDRDLVLYGKYQQKQYVVTLDANGGTFNDNTTTNKTLQVTYGATIEDQQPALAQTKREGYELIGWREVDANGNESFYGFTSPVTSNITLKAYWRAVGTYGVKYVDNEGDNGSERIIQTDSGPYADQSRTIALAWPSGKNALNIPAGKEFIGWKYGDKIYAPDQTFILNADNATAVEDESVNGYIKLEAVYTAIGHTSVKYEINYDGGSGNLTDLGDGNTANLQNNIPLNQATTLSSGAGFSRRGYKLIGWNTQKDANGSSAYASTRYKLGGIYGVDDAAGNTLYAEWVKPVYVDVSFTKVGDALKYGDTDTSSLEGAKFKMQLGGNDISEAIATSDKDGKVTFTSVEAPTDDSELTVVETSAPTGYQLDTNSYKVSYDENNATLKDDKYHVDGTINGGIIVNEHIRTNITLVKVGESNNSLTGAEFTLARQNSDTWNDDAGVGTLKIEDTEGATVSNLPDGTYKLTETKAPAGYVVLGSNLQFKIESGTLAEVSDSADAMEISGTTITIKNTPGSELPSTGDDGPRKYTLAGIVLIAVGLTSVFVWRRKFRGEEGC